jgi:hypothetical protein
MASSIRAVQVYEQLAEVEDRRGAPQMRDRYLVLAADAALTAGQADEAERLRARLLQHNPHHMLRPYASLSEALRSPDVQSYLTNLRRVCPPETAERLLQTQQPRSEGLAATAAVPPANPEEEVYGFQDDGSKPVPPSRPPAAPATEPRPEAAPPLLTPASPWRRLEPPPAPGPYVGGFWIPMLLFGFVLATALLLLVYTLAQPWLPPLLR